MREEHGGSSSCMSPVVGIKPSGRSEVTQHSERQFSAGVLVGTPQDIHIKRKIFYLKDLSTFKPAENFNKNLFKPKLIIVAGKQDLKPLGE